VTHELRESQRRTIAMSRRDASGKLAMFLQSLERNPVLRDGGAPSAIWLPMTRADIAGYIGLTQEALSRATARMTRQGIIKFPNRHQVQIVDSAGLRALAETD
jgi:CRP/FNR family transcriptional regulator